MEATSSGLPTARESRAVRGLGGGGPSFGQVGFAQRGWVRAVSCRPRRRGICAGRDGGVRSTRGWRACRRALYQESTSAPAGTVALGAGGAGTYAERAIPDLTSSVSGLLRDWLTGVKPGRDTCGVVREWP
jgi:hypothetical protein